MRTNRQETYFFAAIAAISLIAAIYFVGPYLAVLAFSALLAILFYPMYHKILTWTKGKNWLALPLSFLGILITFVLPFAVAGTLAFQVIADFIKKVEATNIANTISVPWLVDHINRVLSHIPGVTYQLTIPHLSDQLSQAASWLGSHWLGSLQDLGGAIVAFVPALIIGMYVIGAIFVNYRAIGSYLHRLSPLSDQIDRLYLSRIKAMGLSMVQGTFVIALVQGIIVGLLLWVGGVRYAAFFGLLAVLVSVIPMGAGLIMIPIGIFLLLTGQFWQGIVVILGCTLVVANVDAVLRPRLVSSESSLNPALTIIGLFAGLSHFGFLGVIYGPVLMIFFVTTVEVYMKYFRPGADASAGELA